MNNQFPTSVKLVEVGPRDGLQNESKIVPVDVRVALINRLSESGLSAIEVGSFVAETWVPQMAKTDAVFAGLNPKPGVTYSALVPNITGFNAAMASTNCNEVSVFCAASETFSQKNINCSIDESFNRFTPILEAAKQRGIKVRAYVSCVLGCPYEGDIAASTVADIASRLNDLGCYEISLGDTIGVGTPFKAQTLIDAVVKQVPLEHIAVHFHDTYGQALANIYAVLQQGVRVIDSAVAGLGGCPYAPGASGNVATEDVVYLLDGLDIQTGVQLPVIIAAGQLICRYLKRTPSSKVAKVHWGENHV